jgi:hypothetical protein
VGERLAGQVGGCGLFIHARSYVSAGVTGVEIDGERRSESNGRVGRIGLMSLVYWDCDH